MRTLRPGTRSSVPRAINAPATVACEAVMGAGSREEALLLRCDAGELPAATAHPANAATAWTPSTQFCPPRSVRTVADRRRKKSPVPEPSRSRMTRCSAATSALDASAVACVASSACIHPSVVSKLEIASARPSSDPIACVANVNRHRLRGRSGTWAIAASSARRTGPVSRPACCGATSPVAPCGAPSGKQPGTDDAAAALRARRANTRLSPAASVSPATAAAINMPPPSSLPSAARRRSDAMERRSVARPPSTPRRTAARDLP